jgi:Tol biopolymer transport system component
MSRIPRFEWIGWLFLSSAVAYGQTTRRVSVDSAGAQGDGAGDSSSISADGRWVAFTSHADNLVPGDSNQEEDVFIHDCLAHTTECVSVDPAGLPGNGMSFGEFSRFISADGRFVVFTSLASDLVPGDANGLADVFLRDRQSGTTEIVSISTGGSAGDGDSYAYSVSRDGRFVAFGSKATTFAPGATGAWALNYVRDRQLGTTEVVSIDSNGVLANNYCGRAALSGDGRFVAFGSTATNLDPGDANGFQDVFLRDRLSGTTELVSLSSSGTQGNETSVYPWVSDDGRYVEFMSLASNLAGSDWLGTWDVFVRDRQAATTELVSVAMNGSAGNSPSDGGSMTPDGRFVAFESYASDLVPGDTNGDVDIFVRDRLSGTTQRVSLSTGGAQAQGWSQLPTISDDGGRVVFISTAANLGPPDTNGVNDTFLRDRNATTTTDFTSLCDPGAGSVIACPCGNPPSGPDRGCDNSAGTGGASLSASGNTELTADGLEFTASGARIDALCILAQGTAPIANGVVYGQGVRCIGGSIRRLFTGVAAGGTATIPDLVAGDTPVSVRSAQKGDVISPGQSRWYLLYYRDPFVLGGCPPTSTFNSTQTGRIDWSY